MRSASHRVLTVIWSAVLAFLILAFGSGCWALLLAANFKSHAVFPWSVPVMALVLWLMWQYLGGSWWPRSNSDSRRRYRRTNPVSGQAFAWALLAGVLAVVALAAYWIVLFQLVRTPPNKLPSMEGYPHLTILLVLVMASLVAPFTEEPAFRGYCQVILERNFSAPAAVAISSLFFALAHLTYGLYWTKLLVYFLVGVTPGVIAYLANSIWATIPVHIIADLSFFTLVWPHDAARRLVSQGGADPRFWLHVLQAILFTTLAVLAFSRLAKVTASSRAAAGNRLLSDPIPG
ncbi:MAG TPA: type II CAAX endopeptidase family protein [Candidatus Acidoferrales bacterium]|nr:type II CAAX endopeptidase family protein [Candidatus Acidoferrales bacterium]